MTRTLSIILAAFLGIVSLAGSAAFRGAPAPEDAAVQQVKLASSHSLQRNQGQLFVDGQLFSGLLLDFDMSGTLIYSKYESGHKDGNEVAYYPNGQLAFKRNWIEGKREGETIFWWPNGQLKSRSTYSADLLSGSHSEWLSDGTLLRQFSYVEGKEEGPQKMWYEDGSIRANYVVKDGRRFGSIGAKGCTLQDEVTENRLNGEADA
ncbi:toxin-antitoxin system YwqK family antitoxin [bacterium]|nr:toxin-antitoxin system YwqK family antitoxin [bacterium]